MKWHIGLFLAVLLTWLLLTGPTYQELITGVIVSIIITMAGAYVYKERGFNPGWFLLYIPYYLYWEVVSHLEVIYRILTGRIRPGIVSVPNRLETNFGTTALANSITMTPGTLTLEATRKRLFIHCLSVKPGKEKIPGRFEKILGRVWG